MLEAGGMQLSVAEPLARDLARLMGEVRPPAQIGAALGQLGTMVEG